MKKKYFYKIMVAVLFVFNCHDLNSNNKFINMMTQAKDWVANTVSQNSRKFVFGALASVITVAGIAGLRLKRSYDKANQEHFNKQERIKKLKAEAFYGDANHDTSFKYPFTKMIFRILDQELYDKMSKKMLKERSKHKQIKNNDIDLKAIWLYDFINQNKETIIKKIDDLWPNLNTEKIYNKNKGRIEAINKTRKLNFANQPKISEFYTFLIKLAKKHKGLAQMVIF